LTVIVLSVLGIFYLAIQLQKPEKNGAEGSSRPQNIKIKAAARSYTKLIALNKTPGNINSSSDELPTPSVVPTSLSITPNPSLSVSVPVSPSDNPISPTDIIIAKVNLSPTTASSSSSLTGTISPVKKISQLPVSGYSGYTLAILGAGLAMILFAFVL